MRHSSFGGRYLNIWWVDKEIGSDEDAKEIKGKSLVRVAKRSWRNTVENVEIPERSGG